MSRPRRCPTSRVPASWRCSATRSPPTTSRPAGNIAKTSPAAKYLMGRGVEQKDFNQYGARRGNHDVMMRGTFANIRIKNEMLGGKEGGLTMHWPDGDEMSIYDAAMEYKKRGRAAGRDRRQGVRHRLLARLGGQGHDPAGRQGRDRRELRAHPPLQPGRHGRAAAGVQGRHGPQDASASTAARSSTSSAWRRACGRAWT